MGMKLKQRWLYVLFITVAVLTACSESTIEKETTSSSTSESKQKETKKKEDTQQLKVGEAVNFDGVKVTLNSVRVQAPSEFQKPEKGQFLVVNLTAENTTKEEEGVSSILNVELYDPNGYKYNSTILVDGIQGQFDGQIVAGGTLRGEIPFDVPVVDTYELHFSNPFQTGKAIWKINASDIQK